MYGKNIGLSKKWDPRLGTFSGTKDPRPGTLNVGPEYRDQSHRWDPGRDTRDTKVGT